MANIHYDTELGYSIVGAWGLRRLVSGYSGPIVRIRDTTGDAEQDVYAAAGGELNSFTVTGSAAITTVYDQSGNSANLVQATTTLQPLLILAATGAGGPAARFDGVDDFLRDGTASTTRPYLVANPVHVSMSGPRLPREQFAKVWCIPHNDGANTTPFSRLTFEQDDTSTLNQQGLVRVDSVQRTIGTLFGFNNREGWNGHALVSYTGLFLQAGAPATSFTADTTITYPNNTRMYIGANGLGAENNGMDWCEHVVYSTNSPVQADIQALVDEVAYNVLIGANRFYRMTITGSFSPSQFDAGFAEIELRATASGADLTAPNTPFTGNKRFNGTESWEEGVDNNNATQFSSGDSPGSTQPVLYAMLSTNTLVNEVYLRARSDTFEEYTVSKYILAKFTDTGWQSAIEVDNVAEGCVASQTYVDTINWGAAPIEVDLESEWTIVRILTVDLECGWDIPLYVSLECAWDIENEFAKTLTSSYKIDLGKSLSSSWNIPLFASLESSWDINATFGRSLHSSYKIALGKSLASEWKIAFGKSLESSWDIVNNDVPQTGFYIERLPETPVIETWEYSSKITTARTGLEQRASVRKFPRVSFEHRYVILDGNDFRHFQGALLEQRNQDIRIGHHSLAVAIKGADYNDLDVYVTMDATDIRAGDVVAFFDIGSELAYLRIVDSVSSDHFTLLTDGYPFTSRRGIVVMPTRLMRFVPGAALSMLTIYGETKLTFRDAESLDIMRPGAMGGLVEEYEGYPLLTSRPLANDALNSAYDPGFRVIDYSPRLAPVVTRPRNMPDVAINYSWNIRRGTNLDYWREFADMVRGSWRAFLMPTFRPDLVTVAFAGTSLTVAGNMLEQVLATGGYKRLMITTNVGVDYYTITGIVLDGNNTTLVLNNSIVGATITEISFVNLVRIADDVLTFEHYDLYSELTLNVKVVQQ